MNTDTREMAVDEMSEEQLVLELRRVRVREGKGSETPPGGWKRRFAEREQRVSAELYARKSRGRAVAR
jgi:hypothetical protein